MTQEVVYMAALGIAQIRIDRPAKKNALTAAMYGALTESIIRADGDDSVRVIVIRGSESAFSAGNDLTEFMRDAPAQTERPESGFMRALVQAEKVTIAAVSGLAVGIGTTLLLHCDLVIAGRASQFSLPFVRLGLVPEFASSLLLPRLIGRARAGKHLLLGDPFDAATALDYGLVSEVVEDAHVVRAALEWATRLVGLAPSAVRETKRLLRSDSQHVSDQISRETAVFSAQLRSPETREALSAFVEKRAPRFVP